MKTISEKKNKARKTASEFVRRTPRVDITGKRYGNLMVLEYHGSKGHSTYWKCLCDCGEIKIIRYSHLSNEQIISCGCARKSGKDHHKWSGYKEINGTYICNVKNNAKKRNLEYSVSDSFIWNLFLSQDRKCKLSDKDISFEDNTASLDRIDSSIGYVEDNVQWVHKDVNRMKQEFSEAYFIETCRSISSKAGV